MLLQAAVSSALRMSLRTWGRNQPLWKKGACGLVPCADSNVLRQALIRCTEDFMGWHSIVIMTAELYIFAQRGF
jgi:hypothetical protein